MAINQVALKGARSSSTWCDATCTDTSYVFFVQPTRGENRLLNSRGAIH